MEEKTVEQPNPKTLEVAKELFGGGYDQAVDYLTQNPEEAHDVVAYILNAAQKHPSFQKAVLGVLATRLAERRTE